MKTIALHSFTEPHVLFEIGAPLLSQFLDRFEDEMQASNIVVPDPNPQNGLYFDELAALLLPPSPLPDCVIESLVEIEEMANPENPAGLQAAVAQAPPGLALDPSALPEKLALQLWLARDQSSPSPSSQPFSSSIPQPLSENERNLSEFIIAEPSNSPLSNTNSTTNQIEDENEEGQAEQPPRPPASAGRAARRNPHRCGKIAHMRKADRDKINEMISDGFTYREIIEALGEAGEGLTEKNLSNWKSGGYLVWEREQQRLQGMLFRQEFAVDLVRQNDGVRTHQAAFQIAALQICDLVNDFDPALLKDSLQTNPAKYAMLLNAFTHLLNAMPKLSRAEADCERRRAEAAEAAAQTLPASEKAAEKPPGLSAESQHLMEQKLNLM